MASPFPLAETVLHFGVGYAFLARLMEADWRFVGLRGRQPNNPSVTGGRFTFAALFPLAATGPRLFDVHLSAPYECKCRKSTFARDFLMVLIS